MPTTGPFKCRQSTEGPKDFPAHFPVNADGTASSPENGHGEEEAESLQEPSQGGPEEEEAHFWQEQVFGRVDSPTSTDSLPLDPPAQSGGNWTLDKAEGIPAFAINGESGDFTSPGSNGGPETPSQAEPPTTAESAPRLFTEEELLNGEVGMFDDVVLDEYAKTTG